MESETEEWKESWRNDWLRSIAAFASQAGGTLIIGKKDKTGEVVGVNNPNKLLEEIPSTIWNKLGITPTVEAMSEGGRTCIVIRVKEEGRPVALDGVFYKRVGSTTRVVAGNELQTWILSSRGMSWTDIPARDTRLGSLSQEAIDFFVRKGTASRRMSLKAVESDNESILRNYKMINEEGQLLNSGAIAFLEEPGMKFWSANTKIGAFSTDDRLLRHDQIDCAIVMQPDKVMDLLLNKYILGTDEIEGLMMVTKYPYPEKALREAIMNATIHRDYSKNVSTYIRVYPDHVSISNPGSLPEGWTEDHLFNKHESKPTNPAIAKVFFDMGYIEAWGSGIELIRKECELMGLPMPEYVADSNRVEITFKLPEKKGEGQSGKALIDISELSEREAAIFMLICKGDISTFAEISDSTGLSKKAVRIAVNKLAERGFVKKLGGKRYGKWVPYSKSE